MAVALLSAYLWRVGLVRASALASVLALLVAVVALVAPYLLPPNAARGDAPSAPPALPVPAQEAVPAKPGDNLSKVTMIGEARVTQAATRGTHTHMHGKGVAGHKGAWVTAIMAFADIEDPEFRRIVLRQMGDRLNLGRSFLAPYRSVARDHVVEIVDRCWEFKDPDAARNALARTLISLRPDDGAVGQLERLA